MNNWQKMKKYLILLFSVSVISSVSYFVLPRKTSDKLEVEKIIQAPSAIGTKENTAKRFEFELRQQIDPNTGKIPDFIHKKELKFSKNVLTKEQYAKSSNGRIQIQNWTSEGPFNVGGRTRALALDVLDENTILAGGVSGGMWKSTNAGISWKRTSHPATINSSTCLVQDIRPGKENNWYQGTGELRGNSARAPGAPYRGDGIFASTDNGETWDLLPSTTNNQLAIFESPFNYVWNIIVNPKRTDIDEIYAAIYGGIVRSQDGGLTWTTVLGNDLLSVPDDNLNDSGAPFFTNIIQTNSGIFYATLSVFTSTGNITTNKGIFRSIDGENWNNISPPGLTFDHTRIVMDFAGSNENIVYFFVDGQSTQIWKYDDGATITNWQNLSSSIPKSEGSFDGMDTQDGFNMIIKINPEDENIIFLGGTNLFRSTDGFATSDNTTWIGGYDLEDDGSLYEGHHPDQHDIIFYPSDSRKSLSAHDGGISLTSDNQASQPSWVTLNNGYVTSQFYTISISPDEGDDALVGGLQDNGSYAKSISIENPPWNRVLGGDGAYCSTTPGNLFWYVSFQESQIFRITLNDEFRLTSFAQVDPIGGEDYLFINPFVLDPNNYNRMYLAGGEVLWRNDNLSQVKSGVQESTSTNWTELNVTRQVNTQITALDISTNPQHIVYYGNSVGEIFKVSNANELTATSTMILSSLGAYPACVSVDPVDAENVMVIYSNYNVPSIFFSNDGGNIFTDVGGNLEENTDGTGNGPSIRWGEIIPMADGSYQYYLGTSVGLYSTDLLDGTNTQWVREGNDIIGNSVVKMMDYRSSDGRLVIATHGNGVFETKISGTLEVIKESSLKESLSVNEIFPNPFNGQNPVKIDFDIPELGAVRIDILNNLGQHVKTLLYATQFPGNNFASWDGTNSQGDLVKDGMYHYRMRYGTEIVTGKIIFDQ